MSRMVMEEERDLNQLQQGCQQSNKRETKSHHISPTKHKIIGCYSVIINRMVLSRANQRNGRERGSRNHDHVEVETSS